MSLVGDLWIVCPLRVHIHSLLRTLEGPPPLPPAVMKRGQGQKQSPALVTAQPGPPISTAPSLNPTS